MKIIILAAGYATRLYPLTKNKPKALLPIGTKALLDHLFDKIEAIPGVSEVLIVTNDRFANNFSQWADAAARRVKVQVLNDGTTSNDNRLGAIGDLEFAVKKSSVKEDFLVLASDNLFDESLAEFVEFSQGRNSICIGAYDIKDKSIASKRYGIFELDPQSQITAFEEKPENPKTSFVSMGIYYFPASTLSLLDEYMSSSGKGDAPGYYLGWLMQRTKLFAFLFKGQWYDIGSLEQLEEASKNYQQVR